MGTLRNLITDATEDGVPLQKVVRWLRNRGLLTQITIIRYPDGWAIEAPELQTRFPSLAAKLTQPGAWKRLKTTDIPAAVLDAQLAADEEGATE